MHRVISGLKWARALDTRPAGIPVGRPRGAKRHGVKYERDFAKALPEAVHGQWFEFWDANGYGVCQPDLMLRVGDSIVILECKYTWVPGAYWQVEKLYKPVVEAAGGLRAYGVTVCKNLTPEAPKSTPSLEEAIRRAMLGRGESVLHWLAGPPWTDSPSRPLATPGARPLGSQLTAPIGARP